MEPRRIRRVIALLAVSIGLTVAAAPLVVTVRAASSDQATPSWLTVISEDGARVWMDGEVVLDAWSPHESRVDRAPVPGGKRRFRLENYEIGGFAELRFDIQRR